MNDANDTAADKGGETIRMEHTPGSILRKLREAAGLSHGAVGEALHLTVHYVKALESDEYGKLPGLTFVKGYLRSYARLMQADVDAVMASFEQYIAGLVDEGQRTEQVQRSRRRHDQALRWAIATSVILVLGIAGGWWFKGKSDSAPSSALMTPQPASSAASARAESAAVVVPRVSPPPTQAANRLQSNTSTSPVSVAASTTPAVPALTEPPATIAETATTSVGGARILASADPTEAVEPQALQSGDVLTVTPAEDGTRTVNLVSSGDDLLELSFSGNSWVEIDDGANTRLYSDLLRNGDALTVHGAAPFTVLLGDAPNVSVRLNSEAVNIAADIRGDSTARLRLPSATAAATNIQTATEVPR